MAGKAGMCKNFFTFFRNVHLETDIGFKNIYLEDSGHLHDIDE